MSPARAGTTIRGRCRVGASAALLAGVVVALAACTSNSPAPTASGTTESGTTATGTASTGTGTGTTGTGSTGTGSTGAAASSADAAAPSGSSGEASSTAVPDIAFTPVTGSVLFPPVPFEGSDGNTHMVYELSVVNFSSGPTTIDKVEVLDEGTGQPVLTLGPADLGGPTGRLQPAGLRTGADQLAASEAATIFLHVTLPPGARVPSSLVHQVTVTAQAAPPALNPIVERITPTAVDTRTLPVLGPPVLANGLIAADGCCDATRHTRAILAVNGQPYVAQRYAIDYEQIDDQGRIYAGPSTDPSSYAIYGEQAIAVADGTIAVAVDGLPEQTPGTFPTNITPSEADGNSVVVDIGNGFYTNYAHFQPGSVKVKVGDSVKRGDVLGLVGNSGNSVAPHLHFHVMNGPSQLASEGLPYLIDSFTVTGQVESTAAFDTAEAKGTPIVTVAGVTPTTHTDQMVLDQNIVTYQAAG